MDTLQLRVALALGVAAVGAGFDIVTRTIPNAITFGGILAGIGLNMWSGFAFAGAGGAARAFGLALLGMLISALMPLIFFLRGELGGGDVKLLAAVGAFIGPALGLQALAWTYAVMLALLPIRILASGRAAVFGRSVKATTLNLFRPRAKRIEVPVFRPGWMIMGPSIFAGLALCAWFNWRLL